LEVGKVYRRLLLRNHAPPCVLNKAGIFHYTVPKSDENECTKFLGLRCDGFIDQEFPGSEDYIKTWPEQVGNAITEGEESLSRIIKGLLAKGDIKVLSQPLFNGALGTRDGITMTVYTLIAIIRFYVVF